jgi:hypothetical protein
VKEDSIRDWIFENKGVIAGFRGVNGRAMIAHVLGEIDGEGVIISEKERVLSSHTQMRISKKFTFRS